MDKHIERALIEIYFAIADAEIARGGVDWPLDPERTAALLENLAATRASLETAMALLRQARDAAE